MKITSYRLVKEKHARRAFDGKGARLYGGSWNSQGGSVVYTSDFLALCCLEIFVNLPSYDLLKDFVYIKLFFDEKLVRDTDLRDGWNDRPVSNCGSSGSGKMVKINLPQELLYSLPQLPAFF